MTCEEAQALMEEKLAEAKNYANLHDEMVMAEAKRYARQVCTGTVYHTVEEVPQWAKETVERLTSSGVLRGGDKGDLALSEEMLRILVILERAMRV